MLRIAILLIAALTSCLAQDGKLRVIAFGAHPDDCVIRLGGTAAKWARAGVAVKFVSVTNGDAGHQTMGGGALARRRYKEAQECGRRLGIAAYTVLGNHDGELMPTLEVRREIIRLIRQWKADIVIGPRPNDYHPDHRYTGMLMQDAAYMVIVPNIVPEVPALRKNPIFMYVQDRFQRPNPFRPDVAVDIDDVWNTKIYGLDAHVSQVYEWLPWTEGRLAEVPRDPVARRKWLGRQRAGHITPAIRAALARRYGAQKAAQIQHCEAFQLCEYGRHVSRAKLSQLFPK